MLAAVFSGCTVSTTVSVSEPSPGHGSVAVSVTLDRAALSEVGGLDALRSDLSVGDLVAAGWTVTGPTATAAGGAVVSARHPYSSEEEAGRLLGEVAGPGVFKVSVSRHRTFWRTYYRLSGSVDLTCGLGCFGDSALSGVTGSPVGVDPAALAPGEKPSSALQFSLHATLPGRVQSTNATSRQGGTLSWRPVLGGNVVVGASSSSLNGGVVIAVAAAGAAVLVGLLAILLLVLVRRRRRRRAGSGLGAGESGSGAAGSGPGEAGERGPGAARAGGGETVTPPS